VALVRVRSPEPYPALLWIMLPIDWIRITHNAGAMSAGLPESHAQSKLPVCSSAACPTRWLQAFMVMVCYQAQGSASLSFTRAWIRNGDAARQRT